MSEEPAGGDPAGTVIAQREAGTIDTRRRQAAGPGEPGVITTGGVGDTGGDAPVTAEFVGGRVLAATERRAGLLGVLVTGSIESGPRSCGAGRGRVGR